MRDGSDKVDEVVDQVITITELPAGVGQAPQPLPEPIEILKFKEVKFSESLHRPEKKSVPRMITPEEAEKIVKSGTFLIGMVPKKILHCKQCDAVLPDDRGIHCRECRPSLQDDPGEYIYCGVSGE